MFSRLITRSCTKGQRIQQQFLSLTSSSPINKDKVVITAALNGVLTDPKKFNVPVTPDEMATAAAEAYDAGASVVHIHFRDQRPGMGNLPTWDPIVGK